MALYSISGKPFSRFSWAFLASASVRALRKGFRLFFLCLALGLLTASVSADVVRLLDGDAESLQARFALLDGAEHSIQLAYYWIDGDAVSCSVFACLRDARRRGVCVQVLVDGHRNRIPPPMSNYLLSEGIEIREYHPLRWRYLPEYWERLHDKMLVADGQAMIVGGRNVNSKYFGQAAGENFRDRDILVIGPAAEEASAYFDCMWSSEHVEAVPFRHFPDDAHPFSFPALGRRKWMEQTIDSRRRQGEAAVLVARARPPAAPRGVVLPVAGPAASAVHAPPSAVRFLHSNRVVESPGGDITEDLLELLGAAQSRIDIESAYLVLSDRFFAALADAVQRGVPVSILTNSLASTNQVVAQAGYVNQRTRLLNAGIDLWEYQGDGQLHAKCLAIDNWAVVGSYNLHPRSEYYDTEVAVVVEDAWLAAQLRACMDRRRAHSTSARDDPTAPAGSTVPPRETSVARRAMLQMFRLAAPLIHRQL